MLVELAIRNFAIIDTVRIPFGSGLNVLTGETGAGKSILLDALGAVLGERVNSDMVRTGARAATIDAMISLTDLPADAPIFGVLDELGVPPDDESLILSREIQSSGRSTARLNGRPTTAANLAQIGAQLVDIHGQSDHLSLLRPASQLDLLDRYAGLAAERETYRARFSAWRDLRSALRDAHANARDRMQRVDLLRFQVEEIEAATLVPGEEEALTAERSRLTHAERLARDAALAYEAINGEESGGDQAAALASVRLSERTLADMAEIDPAVRTLAERVGEIRVLLEDVASDIRGYRDEIEIDPLRLAEVEERLSLLRQLKRKYGSDIDEIIRFGVQAQSELERLTDTEMDAEAIAAREQALAAEVGRLAEDLSQRRQHAARSLAAGVESAIAQLNMGSALFSVAIDRSEDLNGVPVGGNGNNHRFALDATGLDRVTFLVAPNRGEVLKPLARIASGGETARLMLALKSVLSEADRTPTLVFDEIDVGVGGRSGQVVGEKLWDLASDHQVIVITHLPQIAAYADAHFRIAKAETDGRVVSTVDRLEDGALVDEIAAMLDGMPITPSARASAIEMLKRASAAKRSQRQP
ncbi:MAG: DNA repair protein RecN [Thermomicrobiales bacterium]